MRFFICSMMAISRLSHTTFGLLGGRASPGRSAYTTTRQEPRMAGYLLCFQVASYIARCSGPCLLNAVSISTAKPLCCTVCARTVEGQLAPRRPKMIAIRAYREHEARRLPPGFSAARMGQRSTWVAPTVALLRRGTFCSVDCDTVRSRSPQVGSSTRPCIAHEAIRK